MTRVMQLLHLDCLQYADGNGHPWHVETCYLAAEGGYLDCLHYAFENLHYALENGCPCDERACKYYTARFGI
jgi:hypothetical protein